MKDFSSNSSMFLLSLTKMLSMKLGTVELVAALKKLRLGSICMVLELLLRFVSALISRF